jgi:hypothetical protein
MTLKRYRDWAPTAYDARGKGLPDYQDWYVSPVLISLNVATVLDEANWTAQLEIYDRICESLGLEDFDGYRTFSFGHWATPFEICLINPEHQPLAFAASEIATRLEASPIVCEETLSRLEYEEQERLWRQMSHRERRQCIRRADPFGTLERRLVDRMVKRVGVPSDLWDPNYGWSAVLGVEL